MKKLFLILSLLVCVSISQAQVAEVKISETERIIDKYLEKTGNVVDSVFTKVAPMAEKAFEAYSDGYKARGTITFGLSMGLVGIGLILLLVSLLSYLFFKSKDKHHELGDEGLDIGMLIAGCIVLFFATIIAIGICPDAYVMMKAPEYWVIKDLLGTI